MLIAWDLLTNQLKKDIKVDKKLIPTYHPYNSNRIPTREAVEEFDANDRKVVTHLAKDDKMKGAISMLSTTDSFVENSRICMIATTPNISNIRHTLNTLRYADR
ncbi:hypothetical protein GLOIN_2v1778588 [Rhizophagus irregularis DAOM 181602=DAOM 197198]|uniref:Kinesin motor domain-containing protein n=1 Tax=Rhizophagus irregularis (strain DAOM 181602 / DAOM 197198 / MUCL 43194) TaxID=747089 RepID=A0A2P4PS41_RHIID|nr:hypothetical protein GLOIN_2v1778588 [Rhizophagus irregularis DAOM 181602=DAOM 197198]POG68196.1 hypothetical protein GLOIN_2v1778588 [Rhizophagus irregularis DAOM 181602=DAOM 197198]|eukprot:XP_025175062.1 hypothetical protein GLOIN_2v1778588 [Rhizophagus irregularis DAOM 181602=DAOM 197198]